MVGVVGRVKEMEGEGGEDGGRERGVREWVGEGKEERDGVGEGVGKRGRCEIMIIRTQYFF